MTSSVLKAAALAVLFALPAHADSGLGLIGGTLRLGFSDHALEGGYVGGAVDVAITDHHGIQIDLQYEERATGGIGRIGTTLYMMPRDGQKYGLTLMVADKNDASSTYGQIGAAGMFEVAQGLNLEARAAIGLSADHDLDWITAGAGLHWQATDATKLYAQYDLTEFDEQNFGALAHEVTIGAQTRIGDSPASFFVEASHDRLTGRNRAAGTTTLRAGLSLALGRTGNDQPMFRVSDPMRQILRRGLY